MRAESRRLGTDLQRIRASMVDGVRGMADALGAITSATLGGALGMFARLFRAVPGGFLAPLGEVLDTARGVIQSTISVGAQAVGELAAGLGRAASGAVSASLAAVVGLGRAAGVALLGASRGIIAGTMPALRTVGSVALAAVRAVTSLGVGMTIALAGGAAVLVTGFRRGWDLLELGAALAFKSILDVAGGVFSGVVGVVQTTVALAGGLISGLASAGVGLLASIPGVLSGIASVVSGALTGIANAVTAVVRGLASLIEGTLNLAASVGERALGLLGRTIGAVLSPALSALSADLTDWNRWAQEAMQAETVMARLGAVISGAGEAAGWSAQQLDVMASKMADLGTQSVDEIHEAQLSLAKFAEIRGLQFPKALEAARQLAALTGQSMPAAAQMMGRALESPERGMMALRRAGIVLTENERNSIKWLVASNQVAEAQDVILGKIARLGDVAGAFASTTAGQVNRLRIMWESVGKAIGAAMLPFVNIVTEFLTPIVEGFAQTMKAFFGSVGDAGADLLTQARTWIAENRDTLVSWGRAIGDIVGGVISLIRDGFGAAAMWIADRFGFASDTAGQALASLPEMVTNILNTVRAGTMHLPEAWAIVRDLAINAFNAIRDKAVNVITYLGDVIVIAFRRALAEVDNEFEKHKSSWTTTLHKYFGWKRIFGGDQDMAGAQAAADRAKHESDTLDIKLAEIKAQRDLNKASTEMPGFIDPALQRRIDDFKNLVSQSAAESRRPPARTVRQAAEAAGVDMTPTPAEREGKSIKFDFTGLADQYKAIQRALTGTSPEALAKRQVDATNAVKTAVDTGNTKADQLLDFLKNHSSGGGGGFAP